MVVASLFRESTAFSNEDTLSLRQREYLTGTWEGARNRLSDRGVDIELVYTSEMLWNVHSGLDTGHEYRADLSLTLSLKTDQSRWWRGGEFYFHVQGQHGDGLSERRVGDFQVLSNIDADDYLQVSEAWYRHSFDDGRYWLKIGKQETNTDFAFVEYGGEFLNSSPGFSPSIPLVTYPDQDWGIAAGWKPSDRFSLTAGVFQGRPDGGRSIGNTLKNLYGPMVMVEPSFRYAVKGLPGHLRLGYWWNGDRFDHPGTAEEDGRSPGDGLSLLHSIRSRGLAATYIESLIGVAAEFLGEELINRINTDDTSDDAQGYYITWDQQIYREAKSTHQGIGVFAQYGYSDPNLFEAQRYVGFGAQWTGAVSGRDEDVIGLGAFHVDFSPHAGFEKQTETAVELYYRAQLTPWISVKPDVQYIDNPGGRNDTAWVAGVRTEISF